MCGRYALSADRDALALEFEVDAVTETTLPPRWNIAPTSDIYIVKPRVEDGTVVRELVVARWGLVPPWAEDSAIGARMVNARSETAAEKPSFRRAFAQRPCLIPAHGWYEWQQVRTAPGKLVKQPYFMRSSQSAHAAFAGLYEWWRPKGADPDAPALLTAALLTADAVGNAAQVHDRMPVLLDRSLWAAWLDPMSTARAEVLRAAVASLPRMAVVVHPVSTAVNNARTEGPDLILEHAAVGVPDSEGSLVPAADPPTTGAGSIAGSDGGDRRPDTLF